MKEKENLLKNISLNVIKHWIQSESDPNKKEVFRLCKSEKMQSENPKMKEIVKVIKQDTFTEEGFVKFSPKITKHLENNMVLLERSYAEFDERYRQIVCNALLVSYDAKGNVIFGFMKRNHNYKEKSLVNTLGMVGGHHNNSDETIYSGLIREVSEELKGISFETAVVNPIGYIKQVSDIKRNVISDYHICVLYAITVDPLCINEIRNRENKEHLIWMSLNEVENNLKLPSNESIFDSWCKVALENCIKQL